jgi:VanZ family protein
MEAEERTMELALRAHALWLFAGWAMVVAVVYLSLAPVSIDTGVEQGDKFLHAFAYGALMLWFANLYEEPARRPLLAAAFVAMGIALEFIQGWTGYRTFEVADMLANAVGVAVGWALAPPRLPNFLRGIERVFRS